MTIFLITFVILILIFSSSLWLWLTRDRAPVFKRMLKDSFQEGTNRADMVIDNNATKESITEDANETGEKQN
ncbi:MAG: hypothetical protein AB1420_01930 [Bacillota bacterium]